MYVIYSTLAEAQTIQNKIDVKMGCPIDGIDYNGGKHDAEEITTHYSEIRKHPSQNLWAVFVDNNADEFLTNGEQKITLNWPPLPRP